MAFTTPKFSSLPTVERFPNERDLIVKETSSSLPTDVTVIQSTSRPSEEACSRENSSSEESGEKVKTKLICMWNNVKYSWNFKTKTHFAKDSPIWLLGRIYHQSMKSDAATNSLPSNDFEALKDDFMSRIWLTYRKEFPVLDGSYYTTDCGWGCMLRSGQMLLAQALVYHFLGRDWRWREPGAGPEAQVYNLQESLHRAIVQYFGDSPSPACPLSIHQMVSQGYLNGKKAGEWYGPASVSFILKQILEKAVDTHPDLDTLRIYVAQDCTVYIDDVRQCCSKTNRGNCHEPDYEVVDSQWKSLVLLIPLRLGSEHLNPSYESCLKGLLSLDQCIGIIGGKPKHSLYFVGWQDDYLIHLDPHHCQENVDVLAPSFPLKSFHCRELRKTSLTVRRKVNGKVDKNQQKLGDFSFHLEWKQFVDCNFVKLVFQRIDPSCCVGFYLRTQHEFDELRRNVQHYLVPSQSRGDYPIFAFSSGSNPHVDDSWLQRPLEEPCRVATSPVSPGQCDADHDDDFEFL